MPRLRGSLSCEQGFLQVGRYATKGEKPQLETVCFFDRAAVMAMDK